DSSTFTYKLWGAPSTMAMSPAGLITWHPTTADVGEYSIVTSVTDDHHNIATHTFTPTVGDPKLLFTSTPPLLPLVGQQYVYYATVDDNSGTQTQLAFGVPTGPQGLLVGNNGHVLWTPTSDQLGEQQVVLQVANQNGDVSRQHFTVEVTDLAVPPTIT